MGPEPSSLRKYYNFPSMWFSLFLTLGSLPHNTCPRGSAQAEEAALLETDLKSESHLDKAGVCAGGGGEERGDEHTAQCSRAV